MRREERFLWAHHLQLKSTLNSEIRDVDVFNLKNAEFYEVVWACDKGTAILLAAENWKQHFNELEGKPIHLAYGPRGLLK